MSLSKKNKRKEFKKNSIKNFKKFDLLKKEKELTYVIIKPEVASNSEIVKDILRMIKKEDLKIENISEGFLKEDVMKRHYIHLADKPFYGDLIEYMTKDKTIKLLISGENSVWRIRALCGATNPLMASKGTIRNKYGSNIQMNAVHASASIEEARSEIRNHYSLEVVKKFRKRGFEL